MLLIWCELILGSEVLKRFGEPIYSKNFTHLNYVNSQAPIGGKIKLATVGSFNKLNIFTLKGRAAEGLNYLYDPLMEPVLDDPDAYYGVIAERAFCAPDFSYITFYLRSNVYFQNGQQLKAYHVKRTLEVLRELGSPIYRNYYKRIKKIVIHNDFTLTVHFKDCDPCLPTVIARCTPLWNPETSDQFKPPIGAGPYVLEKFDMGKSVRLKKNPKYWGNNLPIRRHRFNFEIITIDWYKEHIALFEAFKKGEFDVFFDTDPKHFESCDLGGVFQKLHFKHELPASSHGILFNMSRLKDIRIRKALSILFNFEDINKIYFEGKLKRSHSIFENTKFSAPLTESEYAILKKWQIKVPISFEALSRNERIELAEKLFEEAGFYFDSQKGHRINSSGEALEFKIIIRRPRLQKILNCYKDMIERAGGQLSISCLEETIYKQKEDARNYDMVFFLFQNSNAPGSEQNQYFGKKTAFQKGSLNYMQLFDETADKLSQKIIDAKNENEYIAFCKGLDHYLQSIYSLVLMDYHDNVMLIYRKDRIDFAKDKGIDVIDTGWAVVNES